MVEAKKTRVLIVDDEPEVLSSLGNILRRINYEILTAATGTEAIKSIGSEKPDLIILDVMLPDMDGGDVAAAIERNPATAQIPIIFVTGVITKQEETKELKSGKHYVLAKPVTVEDLQKTIRLALGK